MSGQSRRAAGLVVAGLSLACATADVHPRQDCTADIVHALLAERIHVVRLALSNASAGATVELLRLEWAVDSLSDLSGIEPPPPSHFGYLPDPELKLKIEQWEEWFQRNEGCLRFDHEASDLKTRAKLPLEEQGTWGEIAAHPRSLSNRHPAQASASPPAATSADSTRHSLHIFCAACQRVAPRATYRRRSHPAPRCCAPLGADRRSWGILARCSPAAGHRHRSQPCKHSA